ncbi:MAG: DUF4397 domain-containing protein, partial [Chitinophagaceae bacterium]|nr:DUF4397 domain-containing protein [Chitinophagaceae bacterium]
PILIKENFPRHTDSTTGVRFVNLSPNSPELSINLVGSPNGSEVTSLPYKAVTEFKNYSATWADNFYDFEIRNAATGEVLGFYTYHTLARMRNVTLIVRGLIDGPVPFEVVRVSNY